ncbi:MAG TPA: alpha/beta hydrolase [Opitutaceae bacterium]|nr:alpha/beta hydrolase [Opitutaceae bacterium]
MNRVLLVLLLGGVGVLTDAASAQMGSGAGLFGPNVLSRMGGNETLSGVFLPPFLAAAEGQGTPLSSRTATGRALPLNVVCQESIRYVTRDTGPLSLDLYLPEKRMGQRLPVIVWFHGGGWRSGSRKSCRLIWLAAEGFAVASIDYRLSTVARWPAPLEDAQEAIRVLRLRASEWGLDPQCVIAAGESSGANLAGVVGMAPRPANEPVSSRVSAVIDFYGTSEVASLPVNVPGPDRSDADLAATNGAKLLGGIVRDLPHLAREMSPLLLATSESPPFLIVHGDRDQDVPLDQSQRLHARLQELGVSSRLIVLPGVGHGGRAFLAPEVQATVREFLLTIR